MLADGVNRITLLKWARGIQITLPLLISGLLLTGHLSLWMLFVHTVLVGAATACSLPTNQTLLPSLVPKEDVQSAISLQSAMFPSAALAGPALGGVLLQPLGVAGLYIADALSTLAVFIPLFLLHEATERENEKGHRPRPHVMEGICSSFRNRSLRALLLMTIWISLLQGGYQVLLPLFARDQWRVGAAGYGWLRAAAGAGALLGSFALSAAGTIHRKALFTIGAAFLQAGILLVFAHSPFYGSALALIFLVGLSGTVTSALVQTRLYLDAPEHVASSIMALYVAALVGFNAVGGVLGGSLAQFSGPTAAVTWIALVGMVVPLLLQRDLRRSGGR
jgi:predicted MFS family arabinose efflux permease